MSRAIRARQAGVTSGPSGSLRLISLAVPDEQNQRHTPGPARLIRWAVRVGRAANAAASHSGRTGCSASRLIARRAVRSSNLAVLPAGLCGGRLARTTEVIACRPATYNGLLGRGASSVCVCVLTPVGLSDLLS
jgi:hypothetical protein